MESSQGTGLNIVIEMELVGMRAQPDGIDLLVPFVIQPSKRVEFRSPDPSCNGYLAFAAMLMAGLDGRTSMICHRWRQKSDRLIGAGAGSARSRSRLSLARRCIHQGRDRDCRLGADCFVVASKRV